MCRPTRHRVPCPSQSPCASHLIGACMHACLVLCLNPDAAPDHRLVFRPPAVPNNFRVTDNCVMARTRCQQPVLQPRPPAQPPRPPDPCGDFGVVFELFRARFKLTAAPHAPCDMLSAYRVVPYASWTLIDACDPMHGFRPPRPPEHVAGPSCRPARAASCAYPRFKTNTHTP